MMVNRNRVLLFIFFLCVFLVPLNLTSAAVPIVSEIRVADVTTRSFSVIWITSEPSTATLQVYYAPDCNASVNGIDVFSEGNDNTGVIKSTVTGLAPATTYCFQAVTTSKGTNDVAIAPTVPQSVTTETQTTRAYLQNTSILPFGNDLIYHPVYGYDQKLDTGSILMVSIDGASYPVSTWSHYQTLGDVTVPGAIADLNNIFDVNTKENINLKGNERMTFREVRGTKGCTLERWRKVPSEVPHDMESVEVKIPDSCFNSADINCDDIVELGDINLDINGYGTYNGHECFNPDLDQDGDGFVELGDIILVVGQYGMTP